MTQIRHPAPASGKRREPGREPAEPAEPAEVTGPCQTGCPVLQASSPTRKAGSSKQRVYPGPPALRSATPPSERQTGPRKAGRPAPGCTGLGSESGRPQCRGAQPLPGLKVSPLQTSTENSFFSVNKIELGYSFSQSNLHEGNKTGAGRPEHGAPCSETLSRGTERTTSPPRQTLGNHSRCICSPRSGPAETLTPPTCPV